MHKQALRAIVASVRRRVSQGDCPTEPAQPLEVLETALIELADMNQRMGELQMAQNPKGDPTGNE